MLSFFFAETVREIKGSLFQLFSFSGTHASYKFQETTFQEKIETEVGNMRLVYKRSKHAVMHSRPIRRVHQCLYRKEDFV